MTSNSATSMRTHVCGELRSSDAGNRARLCGWVSTRREHGEHLAFVDLRDHTGVTQCVVDGSVEARTEWVLQVEGTVRRRPAGNENSEIATGEIELADCEVEVLARAEPPPFAVDDRAEPDESVRLRYRYVDLRRPRMQSNMRLRSQVLGALRAAMARQGFCELETPLLWTPTPEGAREFAVPSRLHPGAFYVLPQSPQIAKQLLMVGGMDRYFQIARCLRDEDLRADRQFEFSQLDLEASFVTQWDVMEVVTEAVHDAAEAAVGTRPTEPERISWHEAMDRFGVDKPDLRFGMELVDVGETFAATEVRAFQAERVKALRLPAGAGLGRGRLDALVDRAKELGAKGLAWFKVSAPAPESGPGLESPLERFLSPDERQGLVSRTGAEAGDLLLVVADTWRTCCEVLGQLRLELGRPPTGTGALHFCWVTDFPLFEGLDDEGHPVAAHHPFTMPNADDLHLLTSDPLSVRSEAYDLVLNGWELGSGSIRIHREDIQSMVFDALGISREEAEARFGFLLGAFRYGAPPHGGFAVGVDRLAALLAGEENIREVIAFPKTQSGTDPMTGAPKALADATLRELSIRISTNHGRGPAPA
ncbi:MAG TPA: aspartate--tRNA ligase [Acidimicrobiales bacterium]|nr:aspartate--tRNA ligase [Acidimicrobiales bacterium]